MADVLTALVDLGVAFIFEVGGYALFGPFVGFGEEVGFGSLGWAGSAAACVGVLGYEGGELGGEGEVG